MNFKEKVYKQYSQSIYRYVYYLTKNREVSVDVTSEVFVRLFEKYSKDSRYFVIKKLRI